MQQDQLAKPNEYKICLKNQFQFMPIVLNNNNQAVSCCAILDNCSSCSHVLKCTADTVQFKPSRPVELSFRGASSEGTVSLKLVQLYSFQFFFCYVYL